jgi:hypothetical protein
MSAALDQYSPGETAAWLIDGTAVGEVLRRPQVRRAIAEDIWRNEVRPLVEALAVVDPTDRGPEIRLVREWQGLRSELNPLVEASLATLPRFTSPALNIFRRHLRMAAIRKLDASICGSDVFLTSPVLGGDPFITKALTTADGQQHIVKLGRVTSSSYSPSRRNTEFFTNLLQTHPTITVIEGWLFPFAPLDETADAWEKAMATWAEFEPLRLYEAAYKLPLYPEHLCLTPDHLPEGLEFRAAVDREAGVTPELLERLGISAYLPAVWRPILSAHEAEIAALLEIPDLTHRFLEEQMLNWPDWT